jgi:hypothetical protein
VLSSASRGLSPRFVVLALLLGACAGGPFADATPLPPDPSGTAEGCPAAQLEGELLRDDGDGFLVRHAEGFVTPIVWPEGYSVRDGETRELIDPTGAVVAREGDSVSLGGGFTPNDTAFLVCGPFTVTPAD